MGGDCKILIKRLNYPIPRVDDLYNMLAGGNTCFKLDLSNAYHQMLRDDESPKLTTINTKKGCLCITDFLFRWHMLQEYSSELWKT